MDNRLTPEQLLAKYAQENSKEGTLTIFLGASAGVGKTYAMLNQFAELLRNNADAVIGYVECHQRKDTLAVIPQNAEILPLKEINYKNQSYKELDIDAILVRKPQYVIIDELAHSNVHGSRNLKRYQDVLELLAAGINVYTAMNIQHIESLNNIVEQIVGIEVKETVPDSVLERANEVKLIDITPDELIERLKEGKIYNPEKVSAALTNFFRKGNLTALREMALLNTARKVEKQVKQYRVDNSIDTIWSSHDNLLVVLEVGYSTEKIIRSGKAMFNKGFSSWFVVYMDNPAIANQSLKEREKLLELLDLAHELGAQVTPLTGDRLDEAIVSFAKEHNVNTVLLSQSRLNLYYRLFNSSLAEKISELAPEIHLHLISDDVTKKMNLNNKVTKENKHSFSYPKLLKKIAANLLLYIVLGLILLPLRKYMSNINILMTYLLTMILTSRGRSISSAMITAFISTLSFDFFFIPPYFSFSISDLQYIYTFIAMTIVGVVFGILHGNLRFQLNLSRKVQKQTRLLYGFSKRLSESMIESQVVETLDEYMPQFKYHQYVFFVHTLDEELAITKNHCDTKIDLAIAQWVFDNIQSAGYGTNTFASSQIIYLPINSKIRSRGVLAILPDEQSTDFFLPDTQELLENITQLLAATLERIHFTQIAIKTEILLAKQAMS